MTIGEKIQSHRKRLGMSQDELGQKLHVSRQTISLWEKDQTVPTIDNLIRLKDIFGISVDEILCVGVEREIVEELPNEIYQFNFTEEEFKEINRLQRRKFYKRPAILIFVCVLYTILAFSYPGSEYLLSFVIGVLLVTVVYHVKGFVLLIRRGKVVLNEFARLLMNTKFLMIILRQIFTVTAKKSVRQNAIILILNKCNRLVCGCLFSSAVNRLYYEKLI